MKVYLRGVLLKTKNSSRIMQVVNVDEDGPEIWYDLKPLVRGRWGRVNARRVYAYYEPIGMGLIEPEEGSSPPSLGIETEEEAFPEP